tara:strand:+ start:342 stop:1409 length:1068 start_codon:yes stop_codon:yes gene_type:complete
MVYFLGRDVHAAITTEHSFCGISVLPENGEAYIDNVLLCNVTEVSTSDEFMDGSVHGLTTGDPVQITMDGGNAPSAGLAANQRYFAIVEDTDSVGVAVTYADAIAGNKVNVTDQANDGEMNVTRELVGTSDSRYVQGTANTHHTSIMNRNWPQYDGTGRIDTIKSDSTTPAPLHHSTATDKNTLNDVTAIDVTMSKMDEDLALIGLRTGFKATVKNECTVVITKKKTDSTFNILFNKAKCGIIQYADNTKEEVSLDNVLPLAATMALPNHDVVELNNSLNVALTTPNRNFGYRMHIELKDGTETMTLQNLCITDYSVNITADGVTEEVITLYGYAEPKIKAANGGYATVTAADEL